MSLWSMFRRELDHVEPVPELQPTPPDLDGMTPVQRVIAMLRYRFDQACATLSPSGTLRAMCMWALRLLLLCLIPLALLGIVLSGLLGVLDLLGAVLGNLLGLGAIVALVVIAVIAARR